MTQVIFRFEHPDGSPAVGVKYQISLPKTSTSQGDHGVVVPQSYIAETDDTGSFVLTLAPSNSPYSLRNYHEYKDGCCSGTLYKFYVPDSAVPVQAQDLFVSPPPGSVAWDEQALAKLTQAVTDATAAKTAAELARDEAVAAANNIATDVTAIQAELADHTNRIVVLENTKNDDKLAIETLQTQMAAEISTNAAQNGEIASIKAEVAEIRSGKENTLVPGANITIDRTDPLNPVISSTGGGAGGPATWGQIEGNLTDQLDLQTALMSKVTKVAGKDLSTNDFTDAEKQKLASLTGSHFRGLFLSLAELQAAVPVGEAGDYADVDPGPGYPPVRYIWDSSDNAWVASSAETTPMTPEQIKVAYESNPDTNAFTDLEKSKLAGIGQGAEKNYQEVIQTEATEGTESGLRSWSPLRVRQAIIGWWNQSASKTKLDGIQDNATANATDAALRDRSTHTGTQASSTISDFAAAVQNVALSAFNDTVSGLVSVTDTVVGAIGKLQNRINSHIGYGGNAHGVATPTEAGFMSSMDKTKLDSIATGAQQNWAVVDQAEAEAGTSQTARSWTAERVRQAIAAWWAASAMSTKLESVESGAQANYPAATQPEGNLGTEGDLRSWSPLRIRQATNAWWSSSTQKTKLDGIATGATANSTDAELRDRATHTGTQTAATISNFSPAVLGTLLTGLNSSAGNVVATDTVIQAFGKIVGTLANSSSSNKPITKALKTCINGFLCLVDGQLWGTTGNGTSYRRGVAVGVDFFDVHGLLNMRRVNIPTTSKIVDFGGYGQSFWALNAAGQLFTWGSNDYGQLGLGNTNTPIWYPTLSAQNVAKVFDHPSQGDSYSVGWGSRLYYLGTDGNLYCCGYNGYGALAQGDSVNRSSWTRITAFASGTIKNVWNLGSDVGCVFVQTTANELFFAGYDGYGQSGAGAASGSRTSMLNVTAAWGGTANIAKLVNIVGGFGYYDTGSNSSCTIVMQFTDSVRTCGANQYGQCGDGTTAVRYTPYIVPSLGVYELIFTGGGAGTCVARAWDNTLKTWGYNGQYQCANGNTTNILTPYTVPGIAPISILSDVHRWNSGYISNLFVLVKLDESRYDVYSNGYNAYGECADGTNVHKPTLVRVQLPYTDVDGSVLIPKSVCTFATSSSSAGANTYVMVTEAGFLWAWGFQGNGGITQGLATGGIVSPQPIPLPWRK